MGWGATVSSTPQACEAKLPGAVPGKAIAQVLEVGGTGFHGEHLVNDGREVGEGTDHTEWRGVGRTS